MIKFCFVFTWMFFSSSLLCLHANAQKMPLSENHPMTNALQVNASQNIIFNSSTLDSAFKKMSLLKKDNQGCFRIIHIGDSHLQAGFFTSVVRRSMQSFFGNAGRGLVFPYQLAKSNAPKDISSSSTSGWTFNRIAHPEINTRSGIAGFIIQNDTPNVNCHFALVDDSTNETKTFDKIKIFAQMSDSVDWLLKYNNSTTYLHQTDFNKQQKTLISLNEKASQFDIITDSTSKPKIIYGFSLENNQPGLIYHTLAINGAQYEHYNITPLFWKQLPELEGDMYIISLGTNEAQKPQFDSVCFKENVDSFLMRLRTVSPQAPLMICTVADNFKKGIPGNNEIEALNNFLIRYCQKNNLAYWDLYHLTNGRGSAKKWNEKGLMSKDRIHFNATGYEYQGYLLYQALAAAYNEYLDRSKL